MAARRAARLALGEAAAIVASSAAVLACWQAALWLAGSSAVHLAVPALVFAAVFSADAAMGALLPRLSRPMGPASGAFTGFAVVAAGAAAVLHAMHENVSAPSNVADLALAGLVLGMPAGAACAAVRAEAKKIVDTLVGGP